MTSSAFIAGATGFVGRQVVAQLCARGRKTIAHVRPDSPSLAQWQRRFTDAGAEPDATAWELAAMTARLAELRPAHVYLCLGTTSRRAKQGGLAGNPYELVDYGLTKLVVDAAVAAAASTGARPRLVYLSSIGADARARSSYLSWRGKTEHVVTASGLPWVIARPSFITESAVASRDDRRPGEHVAAAVSDAGLAVIGLLGGRRVRARYRSTTPEVLAAALIRLAEEAPDGRIAEGDELR